jgi:signal transduction histidine kinase
MMGRLSDLLFFRFATMRAQAISLLVMILTVVLLTASFTLSKKQELYEVYSQILELNAQSEDLTKSHLIVIEVLTDLLILKQPIDGSGNIDRELLKKIHDNFLKLVEAKNVTQSIMPDRMQEVDNLLQMLAEMVMQPSGELIANVLAQTRLANNNLVDALRELQQHRSQLSEKYLKISEQSAEIALGIVIVIFTITALICLSFFDSLAKRIDIAVKQIQQLVKNQKPEPLAITRHDEIGQLFSAVNQVSIELERKGQQLAFGRYTYFNEIRSASLKHLVAGLIHELGNPIAGLKGLLSEYEKSDPQTQAEALTLINIQVEKLEEFNTQLVNFATERSINCEIIDLSEQIKQYVYFLNLDERWYSIEIKFDIINDIPAIIASREQISLLLNNICDNALVALQKSFKKQQSLHFRLEDTGEQVTLDISDNGTGMSPQLINVCLEPYVTSQENTEGAGFGLSICRSVMEDIKGEIEVKSELGKGCKITLNFPKEEIENV